MSNPLYRARGGGAISPRPLRHLFQWSDDEEEVSGYASRTISFVQTGFVSANMAANNNDDDLRHRMEAREQASRTQQEALNKIQLMLSEILANRNNENSENNEREDDKNTKDSFSVDAEVIKSIQAPQTSISATSDHKLVT